MTRLLAPNIHCNSVKVPRPTAPELPVRPVQTVLCLAPLALAACSQEAPLSLDERAKFTAELIAERPECAIYRQKLSGPVANRKEVDQTYEAAKTAYCLKPDV
jgi:hypothetical protein